MKRQIQVEGRDQTFENKDLLELILSHAQLIPSSFVAVSRVNKAWHSICHMDERLLLKCATSRPYLTKRDMMGLFVLSSREADRLPRETCIRRDGGVMYKYENECVKGVLAMVGGMPGWRVRLTDRSVRETNVAQTFGKDWRMWWEERACVPRIVF